MQEQRINDRFGFERRARCEHQSGTHEFIVSNVSPGGLFLQTSMPLLPGDTLDISFELSAGKRIVALVEIVWVCRAGKGSGLGCRIVGFTQGRELYERLFEMLESGVSGEFPRYQQAGPR